MALDNPMAEWMRTERARTRQAQEDVAKAVGKSRSWVATIERGETSQRVRIEDCVLLARHFRWRLSPVLVVAGYEPAEIAVLYSAVVADDESS